LTFAYLKIYLKKVSSSFIQRIIPNFEKSVGFFQAKLIYGAFEDLKLNFPKFAYKFDLSDQQKMHRNSTAGVETRNNFIT